PGHPNPCAFHAREEVQLAELHRLQEELASLSGEFKTVTDLNHVIAKLWKLVAANRIPIRSAQLLAYLAQLLLYSHKAVRHELTAAQGFAAWKRTLRAAYSPPQQDPPAVPSQADPTAKPK